MNLAILIRALQILSTRLSVDFLHCFFMVIRRFLLYVQFPSISPFFIILFPFVYYHPPCVVRHNVFVPSYTWSTSLPYYFLFSFDRCYNLFPTFPVRIHNHLRLCALIKRCRISEPGVSRSGQEGVTRKVTLSVAAIYSRRQRMISVAVASGAYRSPEKSKPLLAHW